MYDGDSFFTLALPARIGLGALSACLAVGMILVARALGRRLPRWAAALAALGLWWAFLWLSPQVYYLYYQAVIPGLPWQVVIRMPPGPAELAALLSFTGRATLAAHSQGLMGWAMVAAALWPRRQPKSS